MSYDIALGLDAAAVNSLLAQFYGKQGMKEKFFKGLVSGELMEKDCTVGWEISQVPYCTLAPPSAASWSASIAPDGKQVKSPLPSGLLFQLHFPAIHLSKDIKAVIEGLVIYASIALCADSNALCITPLAINETESKLSSLDKQVLNFLVVPQLFLIAGNATSSLALPGLSQNIFGTAVTFVKPVLTLTEQRLVLATSKSGKALDVSGVVWPSKSVFLMAQPEFVISIAKLKVDEGIKNLKVNGSDNLGGLCYSYSASIDSVPSIVPVTGKPLQITAQAKLAANAYIGDAKEHCAISAAT